MTSQPFTDDPWRDAESRYQPEKEVHGVITRVTQLGVFVQVEEGIEGIVYAFELGAGPSVLAGFAPGQELQLYVKSIDVYKKRLELSPQNHFIPGLVEERLVTPEVRRKLKISEPPRTPDLPIPELLAGLEEHTCPGCQRPTSENWKYCVYCGDSLFRRCAICGARQPDLPDAHYCYECGNLLSAQNAN